MDLALRGKIAAVMAASDGLGKATALALAREGARVAICARGADKLHATAKEIANATGADVHAIPCDLSMPGEPERFVDETARHFGALDVLVTNKGGPTPGAFASTTDAEWQRFFDLLVMSTVRATRAALPHFRARGGGAIVMIESTSVRAPIENLVFSNALRAATVNLARTLAAELAPDHVRVNAVLPGYMATSRSLELAEDRARRLGIPVAQALEERTRTIPLRRAGDPRELANVVTFLASPLAGYVTGVAVPVDGGMTRGS